MESIILFPLILSTNQASCCIPSCICLAKSKLYACSTLLHVAPMTLSHPVNPEYFSVHQRAGIRAKGWVVEQGCSLSTNQSPSVSWTALADEQSCFSHPAEILPCHHFHGKLLPLELCLKPWESPGWGFAETKQFVSKGKKKDGLQWKCHLKTADLSHLFR